MKKKQNSKDNRFLLISWWSLLILIFLIPFRIEYGNYLKTIFTILLVIITLGTVVIVRKKGWSKGPIDLPLLVYLFIAIISSFFSVSKSYSFQAILHNLIPLLIIYFALWQHLRFKNRFIYILWTLVIASIIAILLSFFVIGFRYSRLIGIFTWPTRFAKYLDLLIPITLALAFYYRDKIIYLFFSLIILSIIQLICLFLTGTRASIIALGSVLFFISFFKRKLWTITLGVIIIFFILLLVIPKNSVLKYRLMFWKKSPETLINKDSSLKIRELYYKTVIAFIKERPFIGWGYGSRIARRASATKSKAWYKRHGSVPVPWHAHDIYLEILLETGFIGFIVCVWMWLKAAYNLFPIIKKEQDPNKQTLALGCIAAILAISIHCLVSIPYRTTIELIVVIFTCAASISKSLQED